MAGFSAKSVCKQTNKHRVEKKRESQSKRPLVAIIQFLLAATLTIKAIIIRQCNVSAKVE